MHGSGVECKYLELIFNNNNILKGGELIIKEMTLISLIKENIHKEQ